MQIIKISHPEIMNVISEFFLSFLINKINLSFLTFCISCCDISYGQS